MSEGKQRAVTSGAPGYILVIECHLFLSPLFGKNLLQHEVSTMSACVLGAHLYYLFFNIQAYRWLLRLLYLNKKQVTFITKTFYVIKHVKILRLKLLLSFCYSLITRETAGQRAARHNSTMLPLERVLGVHFLLKGRWVEIVNMSCGQWAVAQHFVKFKPIYALNHFT